MSVTYNASIVRNSLVMHLDAGNIKSYPGTGTVWYDLTSYQTNFNLQNGTVFNSSDPSFSTDGVNDMIIAGNNTQISFTNQITVSVWFKRFNGIIQRLFTKYDTTVETAPFYVAIGSNNRFFFDVSDGVSRNTITSITPTYGSGWNNFVCTYNGVNRNVYQNGSLIYTDAYSKNMINNTASYRLCSTVDAFTQSTVSNIMLYTRGLSETEVQLNFEAYRRRYGL